MRFKSLMILLVVGIIGCAESPEKPLATEEPKQVTNEPIDSLLKKELISTGVEDQTLRFLLPDVAERFGSGSAEEKFIWSLINQQDTICLNKMVDIIETHGWVSKSRVGDEANQAIWLVIQHAELQQQEKYLPLLKESVAKGESEGWHQAFLEDRISMRNEVNQTYGSQATWDNTLNKMRIYPIEDVQNVNQRRAAIGLETIEEYAEMNGYIFDQKE